jgi:ornithine decarboxylase
METQTFPAGGWTFDTHPEISIEFATALEAARERYDRPFLIIDTSVVRQKLRRFVSAMPRVRPHYAMKANPDRRVLEALVDEGASFEIASIAELYTLLSLGINPREVLYSNPIKPRTHVEYAAACGVQWYVADSREEIRKIVSVKPDAKICLRIETPNTGSDWPLSGKFGAAIPEAQNIVLQAATMGADLAGVTFHVGSQCRNAENWRIGIQRARHVFDLALSAGLKPRLLDIGGGFPVRHTKPIPSIEVIGEIVERALESFPHDVQVVAEPGRYLVSDAGYFVCRVIGTSRRRGKRWMYWDAGMFGGLLEATEGVRYETRTERSGPLAKWQVGGPTCDSIDIVVHDEELPCDVREGDFVYVRNAGAYTTAYASRFNGFPLPEIRVCCGGACGHDSRRSD